MKYSVIDISSSSLSLIVANADGKKTEIVFKDRVSLYLFPHLEGKSLSPRGIDKLTDALSLMKEKCASLGVEACYVISTAALRFIENYEEVRRAVTDRTGLAVNFVDGATEAYCDYVANAYYAGFERPVLIDLGGKSLEICDLSKKEKEDMLCFNFGLIDLHRKFVKKYQPDEDDAKDIKKYVKNRFSRASLPEKDVYATAVLVGPTNCALYDIYAEFTQSKAEDGVKKVDFKKFKKLVKHLLSGADRSGLILNNAPEKLAVIGPAAIVLKILFKRFGVDNIVVSDKGVKEGYLQLVLEGRESGAYYDFAEGKIVGEATSPRAEEEQNPAAEETPAPKRRGRPRKAQNGNATETAGGKESVSAETPPAPQEEKPAKAPAAEKTGTKASAKKPAARRVRKSAPEQSAQEESEKSETQITPAAEKTGAKASAKKPAARRARKSAPEQSAQEESGKSEAQITPAAETAQVENGENVSE